MKLKKAGTDFKVKFVPAFFCTYRRAFAENNKIKKTKKKWLTL